jgi:hypothetical protein
VETDVGAPPPFATHADFDGLSLHDDTIYGLRLDTADPANALWRADLVLDIDHIVEWVCGSDKRMRFRVAPVTLIFHDVTDLALAVDWGDSGHQTALHPMAIDHLAREAVADQHICLDRPYWRWTITLNWPKASRLAFGASGFTLTVREPPILSDEQQLSPVVREANAPVKPTHRP